MAATLEELQTQRAALIAELNSPVRIQFADRSIERRSAADVEVVLGRIDAEIARLQPSQASRVFTIQTSRGI